MPTVNELVAQYITIRDRKDALRKKYQEKNGKLNEALNLIENILIQNLDASGAESVRTTSGTCFISKRSSATVADRDAFFDFVRDHEAWDMLESRCSKNAVEQYAEESGQLPPGVNYRTERTLGVHRPKK